MSFLRSLRGLSIVAILAATLMALLPLAGIASMTMAQNQTTASQMSDCGTCPEPDMVMVNCAQSVCGLAATEIAGLVALIFPPPRFAPVLVAIPSGRHTIPPVSPG